MKSILLKIMLLGMVLLTSCSRSQEEIAAANNKLALIAYKIGLKEGQLASETQPGRVAVAGEELRSLNEQARSYMKSAQEKGLISEEEAQKVFDSNKLQGRQSCRKIICSFK